MVFSFTIPTSSGPHQFDIEPGTSLIFVGANGGGKTRLAVKIESDLGDSAHRISAHRALTLNPSVAKISQRVALMGLRTGNASEGAVLEHRTGSRWGSKEAVSLLNDYDYLVQALFADQANVSLETHKKARAGGIQPPPQTKFEKLIDIWDHILPHRKLEISGDDIKASITGTSIPYAASEMSDGERAIFYLIGQTLMAAEDSLIIFDEPELHIHRSLMSTLWDELEAARPDCGMVLISHDLEFAASRDGQKYVLREYDPSNGWTIEAVPEDTGFAEDVVTLILGSRRPVLFVEGVGERLDQAIYRACYPSWTIIPRGSCEEVIHAVITLRANAKLTRIDCAGIVDADAYELAEVAFLESKGIGVLPVSEIENLMLLPTVLKAIAAGEGYKGNALKSKIALLFEELFVQAAEPQNQLPVIMRYCRRRIDRTLKKIDLSAAVDISALATDYNLKTNELKISELAHLATNRIQQAITNKDAAELLKWYDNKGILAIACKAKGTTKNQFEQWIVRAMRNGTAPVVAKAIQKVLPTITPS